MSFDSKSLVVAPADWAFWSTARTLLVPIIYDHSGDGKHAITRGACTLNQATKSIDFPFGLHYYTMPQFNLPACTSPYTIYFYHGVIDSIDSHLYLAGANTTDNSLSARLNGGTDYMSNWWGNDVILSTIRSI